MSRLLWPTELREHSLNARIIIRYFFILVNTFSKFFNFFNFIHLLKENSSPGSSRWAIKRLLFLLLFIAVIIATKKTFSKAATITAKAEIAITLAVTVYGFIAYQLVFFISTEIQELQIIFSLVLGNFFPFLHNVFLSFLIFLCIFQSSCILYQFFNIMSILFLFIETKKTHNFCCVLFGRGRRIRTLTSGFGDRCATINTIPLWKIPLYINTKFYNMQEVFFNFSLYLYILIIFFINYTCHHIFLRSLFSTNSNICF